jgi:hypothetical protein
MYKILGADQQEYGPVTADQVRQWIAEGRANGATLAQAEGSAEWLPLSSFADFAEALAAKAPPSPAPIPIATAAGAGLPGSIQSRDYDLDIGHCVSRSWALFKAHAGLLIGATLIFLVIVAAFNQLIGLLTRPALQSLMSGNIDVGPIVVLLLANLPEMALSAMLTGGMYFLMLQLMRGRQAGIGDLFAGFSRAPVQLALAGIVVQILTVLGLLACVLPGIYLSVGWILTVPLIIDRQLDFWAAMELSRKAVTQHWWLMFCLLIVVGLIGLLGLVACCVGLLAALPVGLGALMYAYEDIFAGPASSAR